MRSSTKAPSPSAPVGPNHRSASSDWAVPERPRVRRDILVKRRKDRPYLELKLKGAQAICLLYDFEVSLVRKMDGTRSLATLVAEGSRLSVPMTAPQLE